MRKPLMFLSNLTPPALYLALRPADWGWGWSILVLFAAILFTEEVDNFVYRRTFAANRK